MTSHLKAFSLGIVLLLSARTSYAMESLETPPQGAGPEACGLVMEDADQADSDYEALGLTPSQAPFDLEGIRECGFASAPQAYSAAGAAGSGVVNVCGRIGSGIGAICRNGRQVCTAIGECKAVRVVCGAGRGLVNIGGRLLGWWITYQIWTDKNTTVGDKLWRTGINRLSLYTCDANGSGNLQMDLGFGLVFEFGHIPGYSIQDYR